ncbi:hypothetical protein FS749_012395 [Ceratobasidium sp. UAMH 11750]|nr:hypothetical protein FS749_012395 [Ceratobasidium sp. UAMH 11750]
MFSAKALKVAQEKTKQAEKSLARYLTGSDHAYNCARCYGKGINHPVATIETHCQRYPRQSDLAGAANNPPTELLPPNVSDAVPSQSTPLLVPPETEMDINEASSCAGSESDEEYPYHPADPKHNALAFGKMLTHLQELGPPPPLQIRGGHDKGEGGGEGDAGGEDDKQGEDGGGDAPDNLGGGGEVLPEAPPIQVQPFEAGGEHGPEGPDDEGGRVAAFEEHSLLQNIYLRTWAQYAFHGATQDAIQSTLESHKLVLRVSAGLGNFPLDLVAQIDKMPTTLHALEHHLGMDFTDILQVYPICPLRDCGKCYTMEELAMLNNPQCTRHVADRCEGIFYSESVLADGTRKQTPT